MGNDSSKSTGEFTEKKIICRMEVSYNNEPWRICTLRKLTNPKNNKSIFVVGESKSQTAEYSHKELSCDEPVIGEEYELSKFDLDEQPLDKKEKIQITYG